jgi:hypothetical protein
MKEERKRILEMLSDGKINVQEANELIETSIKKETVMNLQNRGSSDKFIYVSVEPKDTDGGRKIGRVFVKVPFALIKAGFNIAGLIPKDAQVEINNGLKKQGMNFDFTDLNPENVKDIMASLEELTVEVDNEDSLIRVYSK